MELWKKVIHAKTKRLPWDKVVWKVSVEDSVEGSVGEGSVEDKVVCSSIGRRQVLRGLNYVSGTSNFFFTT